MAMQKHFRKSVTVIRNLSLYLITVGLILGGLIISLPIIIFHSLQAIGSEQIERTRLEEIVDTAREIRQALARPIPQPPPLEPITQKPAHAVGSRMVEHQSPQKPKVYVRGRRTPTDALPSAAMDSFAMEQRSTSPQESYPTVDRHAVR